MFHYCPQCGITLFPMDGIGMVYAPSEDSRLFGVTVKDSSSSSDFTFFLYKCTVRDSCRCQVRERMVHTCALITLCRLCPTECGDKEGI